MTQREVARALGVSRTYVQVVEWRALNKLRVALGLPQAPCPRWMMQFQASTRTAEHRRARVARERGRVARRQNRFCLARE